MNAIIGSDTQNIYATILPIDDVKLKDVMMIKIVKLFE